MAKILQSPIFAKTFNPLTADVLKKGHAYLNKPAPESCRFVSSMYDLLVVVKINNKDIAKTSEDILLMCFLLTWGWYFLTI